MNTVSALCSKMQEPAFLPHRSEILMPGWTPCCPRPASTMFSGTLQFIVRCRIPPSAARRKGLRRFDPGTWTEAAIGVAFDCDAVILPPTGERFGARTNAGRVCMQLPLGFVSRFEL